LLPQVNDPPVDIVVVDNASTVDLDPVKADFPTVTFLLQPEKGPGPARNLGVASTTHARIFFTDSDCVPDANWVKTALAQGDADKITGGPVRTFDETPRPRTGAQAFETVFAFPFEDYVKRQKFTGTGNMVTTRAVFEATGPFSGGVFEDKDIRSITRPTFWYGIRPAAILPDCGANGRQACAFPSFGTGTGWLTVCAGGGGPWRWRCPVFCTCPKCFVTPT
jgi:glycosyltransferase involved in cell wall biosynthesis